MELLPSAELVLNTMLISEGIYLSDRLGPEVIADELRETSCAAHEAPYGDKRWLGG